MKKKRMGIKLLQHNWKSILLFEVMYKFVAAVLFIPILVFLFNISLKLVGVQYLSNDNLFSFMVKPTSIVLILLVIFIGSIFILIEMMAMVGCFHASYHKKRISASDMFQIGISGASKALHRKNFGVIIWMTFFLPLVNIIPITVYLNIISIPNFVKKYLQANSLMLQIILVVMIAMSLISVLFIYCVPWFLLEDSDFKQAKKKSKHLIYKSYKKTVVKLILWNLIAIVLFVITFVVGIWIVYEVTKGMGVDKTLHIITIRTTSTFINFLILSYTFFFIPITTAFISNSYYKKLEEKGEKITEFIKPKPLLERSKLLKYILIISTTILLGNNIRLYFFAKDELLLRAELFHQVTIMAHRGDSGTAPENTIPAFENAIENMADWIELDVQQTKDGVIVVMHDSNLKRTTGVNKNIWNTTYDEIKNLDAGSWFDERFCDVRIPTLDEVLKLTKGKIKLNIELKPTGHEVNFEKKVIDIIRENDFQGDCIVCSLKYDAIAKVKKIDPEIRTAYVLIVVYSDFWNASAADAFSIEYSFVTKTMVHNIKNAGKDIYVWTVNNEKGLKKMIDMGVDSIITDYPLEAKELLLSQYAPKTVIELLEESEVISVSENNVE